MVKRKRRLPRTIRAVKRMKGKSVRSADRKRTALKPGLRISKSGKKYWETRRNRSDLSRKKRL